LVSGVLKCARPIYGDRVIQRAVGMEIGSFSALLELR
jgi:hypothetical protein